MTRAVLAKRAGMAVEFVEYVESQPAEVSVASLDRLAAALDTTPA